MSAEPSSPRPSTALRQKPQLSPTRLRHRDRFPRVTRKTIAASPTSVPAKSAGAASTPRKQAKEVYVTLARTTSFETVDGSFLGGDQSTDITLSAESRDPHYEPTVGGKLFIGQEDDSYGGKEDEQLVADQEGDTVTSYETRTMLISLKNIPSKLHRRSIGEGSRESPSSMFRSRVSSNHR